MRVILGEQVLQRSLLRSISTECESLCLEYSCLFFTCPDFSMWISMWVPGWALFSVHTYVYIHMCVYVCVCVCVHRHINTCKCAHLCFESRTLSCLVFQPASFDIPACIRDCYVELAVCAYYHLVNTKVTYVDVRSHKYVSCVFETSLRVFHI